MSLLSWNAWDADCEEELAACEDELQRAWFVEPVTPDAAVRLRERIGRLETILARLHARKAAA